MNIAALFKRPSQPVDNVRTDLLQDMQAALRNFTTALQKYEQNTDVSVAYSQMLFAAVEVHRERYYEARLKYEQAYGNLTRYKESLTELLQLTKERNQLCLFRHPMEPYTLVAQTS